MRACGVLTAAVILLLAMPATVFAADDELGLSRDGRAWSAHLDSGLFDDGVRWVPGDRRASSFYARNSSAGEAVLTVAVAHPSVQALAASPGLEVSARVRGGDWTPMATDGLLLEDVGVGPGEVTHVDVAVELRRTAGNLMQGSDVPLAFDVRLSERFGDEQPGIDPDGGDQGAPSAPSYPGGLLPDTGGPAWWLAALGAVLIAVGARLMARRGGSDG